jgi:glutathione S-transferase
MLKIWGRISSINVRKVVLAAQWLGLPFERIDAGHEFGVVRTPEYLAKNPNALVPTIEDDGFQLYESNVVVRYLCANHAEAGLYPQELRHRFDAERWMDWQQTTLNPAGRNAFVQLLRTAPEKRQQKLVDESVSATEPLLRMIDAHLGRRAYMAGDAFTMADIPIACEIHRWRGTPVAQLPLPNVDRWYSSICANPASRGVLDLPLA